MSQPQLRKFLAHRIKTTLKPKEIYADELTLKLFGMVPQDFDLRKSTVDLLTEQAAAFYDYQEKKLFLLDVASFTSEKTTLAHELAHALADQHFDLEKYVDDNDQDDDQNLAHTAVVEGQASWLMLAFQMRQEGSRRSTLGALLNSVEDASDSSTADYPVLQQSPLYIQQSLLFPYAEGTKFFDAVYRKLGKAAFTAVFTDPRWTPRKCFIPDLYFAHVSPTKPECRTRNLRVEARNLPADLWASSTSKFCFGNSRARQTRWRYRHMCAEASSALFKPGKKTGETCWSTHRNGIRGRAPLDIFPAYKKVLEKKWARCDATRNSAHVFAGTGDTGYFVTKLKGRLVTSIEGIPEQAGLEGDSLGKRLGSGGIARKGTGPSRKAVVVNGEHRVRRHKRFDGVARGAPSLQDRPQVDAHDECPLF